MHRCLERPRGTHSNEAGRTDRQSKTRTRTHTQAVSSFAAELDSGSDAEESTPVQIDDAERTISGPSLPARSASRTKQTSSLREGGVRRTKKGLGEFAKKRVAAAEREAGTLRCVYVCTCVCVYV